MQTDLTFRNPPIPVDFAWITLADDGTSGGLMNYSATSSESAWREGLVKRPYYDPKTSMDVYHLAFQYAITARRVVPNGTSFQEVEPLLAQHWASYRNKTGVQWEKIREAVEDVWNRASELAADDLGMHGGFREPPTFGRQGVNTPRSRDEPNR
jgi:hypothetical protein